MFEVAAKCGHVGRNYYTLKTFAVIAENGREAAKIVRWIPRVKHHQADAILYVAEIGLERFIEINEINDADPYFACHCTQEQRKIDVPVFPEKAVPRWMEKQTDTNHGKPTYYGKEKIRNPKKYMKHYVKVILKF